MIEQYASNLASWSEQVLVIASVGALLPVLLRIRHPKTQLAYCHLLLAVCLLAPAIEPWLHPVIVTVRAGTAGAESGGGAALSGNLAPRRSAGVALPQQPAYRETVRDAAAPAQSMRNLLPGDPILLWILAAGAVARLCWLGVALWRIRSYRIAATPLYPIPESVRAASAITQADAVFCVSPDVPGPVMLGWLAPVVLMPEYFLGLDEEAQCGIACHELLHVKRSDWLITLFEELAGALLWFNPAVWLLLGQTRLIREQLVDEEAVRLTGAREPYMEALLAIARRRPTLDLAPAPLFLRRRHLTQRMHLLLMEVSMSKFRLLSSYVSMAAILACAGWLAVASFPLVGQAQVQEAAALPQATQRILEPPVPMAPQVPLQRNRPRIDGAAATLPVAPVPPDSHELVTGPVQVASTPADRLAALTLLRRAAANGVTHAPKMNPFSFKMTFTASGNLTYTGPGELTELWMSGQNWRVTESIGSYSLVRVGYSGQRGDQQAVSLIPMRSHMLRNEVMWATNSEINDAGGGQIRTSAAQWNGKPVTCILLSNGTGAAAQTQSRLWEESEYCIANDSGLLQTDSVAPGVYTVFGYSKNLQFHGKSMPDHITMYVAGAQAVDGDFSITDPAAGDESQLTVTPQMIENARNLIPLNKAMNIPMNVPGAASGNSIQPVMIHAQLDGQGNVVEAELAAAANPALTQSAMEMVKKMHLGGGSQVYVNVRFVPATQ